jgi:hypothetical protein
MSFHIVTSIFWGGDVYFITDSNEIYRVWIGQDYHPQICRLCNDPLGDYSWPIQELNKLKGGSR